MYNESLYMLHAGYSTDSTMHYKNQVMQLFFRYCRNILSISKYFIKGQIDLSKHLFVYGNNFAVVLKFAKKIALFSTNIVKKKCKIQNGMLNVF